MALLHNIRTVAKYEAKILRRSWFFRLFAIGSLVIFTFMNIGLFSPVGDEDWNLISIPSSVPLINLYLLNIGQAIVVIFLAADFLKRDKKVDTNEVLYTRSMSNFEYVIGKTAGILRLFLGLNIIILLIGLLMNIISKSMKVDLASYFYYLLIISIPTIIFSLGLAFMLMSVIRNQAITFLILLGIAALNMFWLNYRFGFIFDYMAFGLPVFKSGLIGFDNINLILNQRLFYLFFGLSLVLATILLFRRLPQSKPHTIITVIFMIVFLAGSTFCAINTYSFYIGNIHAKRLVIDTNKHYETGNFVSMTDAKIEFLHQSDGFEASADIKFINNNDVALDMYIFSLNPSLKVTGIKSGGKSLDFKRDNHIILIDPASLLLPKHTDSLTISYSGLIDESFCFPDYYDNIRETPYRVAMLNINKRQAFLTENYVLLTPESHWYPVPTLNYFPTNPARIKVDFTNYNLKVKTKDHLQPVSQGNMEKENDFYVFTSESPLTGISLAIGNYSSDTLIVDSIRYISYYFPGHDYYKHDLEEIKDTLNLLVSGIMRELETSFSTPYPFRSLGLLEVPVQFYSFPRMNTQTRAELQPSLVLLPEKLSTLSNAGFKKRFDRQKKRMARNNQVITDKELQVRLFNDFIRNTFISGENFRFVNGVMLNEPIRYRLGPSFYFFKNNFFSSEFPVINSVFESHLQKQVTPGEGIRDMSGGLSENDKANLILKDASFKDVLAKNPGADTIRNVVTLKGDYLFNLFRSKAGIFEFNKWFRDYIETHEFQSVDVITLNSDMNERFGFEFYPYLSDWFEKKEQPGFLFSDVHASEIVIEDRVRFLVTFTASNPEPVTGIFNVSFRTADEGGPGRRMTGVIVQGGPGRGGNFSISMQGRGMESSDINRIIMLGPCEGEKISIILDSQPRELLVNTLFSANIPGEINLPIDEIKKSRNLSTVSESEEKLQSLPDFTFPGELVVDNEDPGFFADNPVVQSPLKELLGIHKTTGNDYRQPNMYYAPEYWQPAVLSSYYGKYIRSAVYTRSGKGDRSVIWKTKIDKPDYYDIYCYIGKTSDGMLVRTGRQGGAAPPPPQQGRGSRGESPYKDMQYKIYHDDGVEEITVDFENADAGWNMLGRYYLSSDSAKVELTNQSSGRMVIGDAVKWVKAN
jgi:ABC-type transport system involved in multi-copper enzyme maturation permease subunit